MHPLKIALIGIVVAASQLSPNDFPGTVYSQDKGSGEQSREGTTKKIDPKVAEKLRQARIKETRKKISNIGTLIESINEKLDLRTSQQGDFDQKLSLENQLRDLTTLFALTNQALTEAERLSRKVGVIKRNSRKGLRDSRRLQLANFLEARRQEYIVFATR